MEIIAVSPNYAKDLMSMMQQNMPMMIGMGVLEHLVYGAVLGVVTTVLILKIEMRRRRGQQEEQHTKKDWK